MQKEKPLITVITPTYNRANLLPRAIKSVLDQTYQNFELIIVDDGSTDNTEEVVRTFFDERIKYFKHKKNKGVLGARNTGFKLAKGKYIAFLDDDDELFPEALEIALSKFINFPSEKLKIICFDCIDVEKNKICGEGKKEEGYIPYEDSLCGRISGETWGVMDRETIDKEDLKFDERLWGYESILWLKLHKKFGIFYFPEVLVKKYWGHREHICNFENQLKHLPRIILTKKVFLKEYEKDMKCLCPKFYGRNLAILGFYQLINGEKQEGRKALFKSLKFNLSFKSLILFLLSFIFNKDQLIFFYIKFLDFKKILRI